MRKLFPTMIMGWALLAQPALACQGGGSQAFFRDIPEVTPDMKSASIVQVHMKGFTPGNSYRGENRTARGYFLGTAQVIATVRGARLPATLRVYNPEWTSCSYFARVAPKAFDATGYLVGVMSRDADGPYFSAREVIVYGPSPPEFLYF